MWYTLLLQRLARLICSEKQDEAEAYISELIESIRNNIDMEGDFEAGFLFGLINSLYKYYLAVVFYQVPVHLNDFARLSIGLAILHYKHTDDDVVYCSDFLGVIANPLINTRIGIHRQLSKVLMDYIEGVRRFRNIVPYAKLNDFTEYVANREKIKRTFFLEQIKQIESEAFAMSNYSINADLDETCITLNALLRNMPNKQDVLRNLSKFLKTYINKGELFDTFIASVAFEKNRIRKLMQLSNDATSVNVNLQDKTATLDVSKKRGESSSNREQLSYIATKLTSYVEMISSHPLTLLNNRPIGAHKREVRRILKEIKNGNYQSVEQIIEELFSIKILNPKDPLIDIRDGIGIAYASAFSEAESAEPGATSLAYSS